MDITNKTVAINLITLTQFQAGQLLYIHFQGDFKYRTDAGTIVPNAAWRKMIDTLLAYDLIVFKTPLALTERGKAYLDANHLSIKPLS